MHSRSIIGALLRIAAGVFLGGTVLRDQVAGARALAQTVVVDNPSAHPVPVEEQRVDGSGNLDYRPAACDGPRCRLGDFDFSTTIEVPGRMIQLSCICSDGAVIHVGCLADPTDGDGQWGSQSDGGSRGRHLKPLGPAVEVLVRVGPCLRPPRGS